MRGGQVNKKIPKSQDNFQELDNPFEWVFQTNRGKELPQINWIILQTGQSNSKYVPPSGQDLRV